MGSSASKHKITSQDKAILDLKIQRDKLKKYQKKVNVVIEAEVRAAKKALDQGHKKQALLALKKKKYQEQLLEKTEQQLINLEELTHTIEYALVEKQVMEGLKQGNQVLTDIHKEMSLEDVDKLMDDTAEAIAYQEEIDQAISGLLSPEDEEDILKELEQLQVEEMQAELPSVPANQLPISTSTPVDELPAVPTHAPVAAAKKAKERNLEEPMLA
ncbi:Snf7 family [Gongronella butleri]|nr:Snf7 family [Gongronella butleri]